MADMNALAAIAEKYRLLLVEDACQAHGAEYLSTDGRWYRAGSVGHAAAFSFYPGKNLGACGEGGAVTTSHADVARTVRMLREHGQAKKYYHDLEGYNGRLHAIQAGFLQLKLRRLDEWNGARRQAARRYEEFLRELSPEHVTVPSEPGSSRAVYHLYVIRTKDRDGLADHLSKQGIHTGLHYPLPVHLQNCYRSWGYHRGSLPVTERVASEVLSLPMFPGLTADQQRRVVLGIQSFLTVAAGK
jgi:dTDP-4-amino-4,6-dideoxygalactose transaminase